MPLAKLFMAANKCGNRTGATARDAATAFFATFKANDCRVTEGEQLGELFIAPMRARQWPGITRDTIGTLPE